MKKIVIIAFLSLLLIGLIAPKFVGSKLDDSLNDIVVTVNNVPGYKMHIKEIESNWFTTSAVLVFSIDTAALTQNAGMDLEDFSIEAKYSATHGPFRFGDNSGIGWVGWSAKVDGEKLREVLDWSLDTAFYQIEANMGLFATHTYTDTISPFKAVVPEEDVTFDFSGYQGKGSYDGKAIDYTSKIGSLTVVSDEVEAVISDFTMDMLLESSIAQVLTNGMYDSNSKVNFANIKVSNKETSEKFDLSNLYMTVITELDDVNQLMDMQFAYGVNNVSLDDFTAEDIAIEFEMNNLSGEFIKAYQKQTANMTAANGVMAPEEIMEFFTNNLLLLVSANPEVNITSLRGTLPQGKFTSHFHTSLANVTTLPAMIADPSFWLTHALVDANIDGDKAAIEWLASSIMKLQLAQDPMTEGMSDEEVDNIAKQQVPAMLAMFTDQGFITATDTKYSSTLTLKDKALTLNDKAIPLPF
jgi:uncharacterized protein YdgA (DUF945 family)